MSLSRRRVAAGIAIAIGVVAAMRLAPELPDRYAIFLDRAFLSSREQRLLHFFGECEPGGYGYLKRVLSAYSRIEPSPLKRPVIRYQDYNRRSEYLFDSTRFDPDRSVLVGVGLTESDLREREIGRGSRGADGLWRFTVESNVDLLTRMEVELNKGSTRHLRLQLYRSEKESTPIWNAVADPTTPGDTGMRTFQFVATPPLRQFRYGLIEPFVVRVDEGVSIDHITAFGIVVDIEGYRVVHRKGGCFTAIEEDHRDRWMPLIRELEGSND